MHPKKVGGIFAIKLRSSSFVENQDRDINRISGKKEGFSLENKRYRSKVDG